MRSDPTHPISEPTTTCNQTGVLDTVPIEEFSARQQATKRFLRNAKASSSSTALWQVMAMCQM